MHVSVTTSVREPPARYSITTKSSSPTRKLKMHRKTVTSTVGAEQVCLSLQYVTGQCYLSTKLTMLGFFISFITRISLIISSFFGCFCKLICLMATCRKQHPVNEIALKYATYLGNFGVQLYYCKQTFNSSSEDMKYIAKRKQPFHKDILLQGEK